MEDILPYFFIFLITIFTYLFKDKIALITGLIDKPNPIKVHKRNTPSIGSLLFTPMIYFGLINFYLNGDIKLKIFLIWFILLSTFFIIGIVDDKINLSAKTKTFVILSLLFIVLPLDQSLIVKNLSFESVKYIILLNQGSLFITVFSIFFFYNVLNFSDGLNGLSISLCIFWISFIIIFHNSNLFYLIILIALIITLLPNLLGQLFIGNSGVNFLSTLFSLILILEYNNENIKIDEIILIVLFPAFDTLRVIIERIAKNNSPFVGDKNHFHHHLMKIFNKNLVFIPYILISVVPIILFKLHINILLLISLFLTFYFIFLKYLKNK